MRIYNYLAVLMALCLLAAPAAPAEGLGTGADEVVSLPAEVAVEEAGEVDLARPCADEAPAPEDRAVEPSDYDSDESLDILIPADVTSIKSGEYARSDIKSVRFEAGSRLKEIGGGAFRECLDLQSIELPDTVESVGVNAFMFSGVRHINLPSATYIGNDAFYWSDLETITLSSSLPEILYRTFEGSHLLRIDIPGSVKRIGNEAFKECKGLETLTLSEGLEEIGDSAFLSCESLKGVALPDSVVKIGDKAFSGCAAMETLTLSKGLADIPGQAFAGCGMKTLVVPDNIKKIGNYAFADCENLTTASLPDGVAFGDHLFSGCSSLKSVTLPKGIAGIPDSMFYGCGFKALPLPDSVTTIGEEAFAACAQLESVDIPDRITGIGSGAFKECPALKRAKLPASVSAVSNQMFSKCAALESVEIPEGVTRIGMQAFEYCTSLKTLVLPESVTTIGSLAFRGCTGLETIVIPGENVSFSFYGSSDVTPFSACSDQLTIVCRKGSAVDEYAEEHGIARKYVEPTGITLSATGEVTTKVVHTLKLSASLTPSYATTALTWTSSDPDVAMVMSSDALDWRMIRMVAPGTAVITVKTANGLSASATYRVEGDATAAPTTAPTAAPASLTKAEIAVKDVAYTGKKAKPEVTVKLDGAALKAGTDYTVSCSDKAVGKATATVKGKGNYTGTVKKAFKINPKKVAGLKLQAGKKQLTVKWNKAADVSGYQLQYSLKADFKGAKTVTVNKAATVKKAIRNLKSGKTYYVRIRCYKAVKGTKYWSAWSKAVKKKAK